MSKQSASKKLKRVVIKEELVALTGHYVQALILNQFVYWSERTKDFDQFIDEERKRDPDITLDPTKGWVYKTAEDLSDELMLGMSVSTIRRHLGKLVKSGHLDERNNPNHKWDRTLQYRPNMVKIQTDLFHLGYALEGYPLVVAISKMKNGVFEIENQTPQNKRAIPETTLETTIENISPSAENTQQSSGDFGDPAKGDEPILIEQDAASLFVPVFGPDGNVISGIGRLLIRMVNAGLIELKQYDIVGNVMRYHWVDSGKLVDCVPMKLAKGYGYKPEGDEPIIYPEDRETIPPDEVDDILRKAGLDPDEVGKRIKAAAEQALANVETSGAPEISEESDDELTDAFGPNLRLLQQNPQPQHNDKPLTEADQERLRTFGHLPGNEPAAGFDTIQEIRQAGWEIWDPAIEKGIAYCLEAIRTKKPQFAVPNNARSDWHKSVKGHLMDYRIDDLETLYILAVEKLEKAGMSYTRPGSLTKTLPDVVNEPTQKTIFDTDGGFHV